MKKGQREDIRNFVNGIAEDLGKIDNIPDSINYLDQIVWDVVCMFKIDDLLNGDMFLRLLFEGGEKDLDEDERAHVVRSDLLIRFSNMMHKNEWAPMIKARFEKGLDDLEKFIDQGNLSDKKTEGIRLSGDYV